MLNYSVDGQKKSHRFSAKAVCFCLCFLLFYCSTIPPSSPSATMGVGLFIPFNTTKGGMCLCGQSIQDQHSQPCADHIILIRDYCRCLYVVQDIWQFETIHIIMWILLISNNGSSGGIVFSDWSEVGSTVTISPCVPIILCFYTDLLVEQNAPSGDGEQRGNVL